MDERITSDRKASRRTLIEEINHLGNIYGYRNRFYMGALVDRTTWLSMGAKDLFEVVRKDSKPLTKQLALARVFARIVAVDEFFRTGNRHLPFVKLLCQKYPMKGCSYCKNKPCCCLADRRNSSELDDSSLELQKKWSIDMWQTNLAEVYEKVNEHMPWGTMYGHLTTEIIEIQQVHYNTFKFSQDELVVMHAKELADTFAWTCAFATKLGISLGEAVEKVYGQGCGGCGHEECKCGAHSFDFLDIKAFEARYFQDGEETANTR